jgi:hypothetical protein
MNSTQSTHNTLQRQGNIAHERRIILNLLISV